MNFKSHMNLLIVGLLMIGTGIFISCDAFNEDLPECRLFVKFKYDYNMLSVCAFHKQVDKVELYVFDKDGKFLFQQAEEGMHWLPVITRCPWHFLWENTNLWLGPGYMIRTMFLS